MAQSVHSTMRLSVSTSLLVTVTLAGCSGGTGSSDSPATAAQAASSGKSTSDPPEVTNGERLFLETRFAQFFKAYLDAGGTVNGSLPAGDPVMNTTATGGSTQGLPGPFAGLSMNCRACPIWWMNMSAPRAAACGRTEILHDAAPSPLAPTVRSAPLATHRRW